MLCCWSVALRKESVDRNLTDGFPGIVQFVALRKESVDRNKYCLRDRLQCFRSLSARRAWIEISSTCAAAFPAASLSARRAWIEISPVPMEITMPGVALRKESVDRNRISFR